MTKRMVFGIIVPERGMFPDICVFASFDEKERDAEFKRFQRKNYRGLEQFIESCGGVKVLKTTQKIMDMEKLRAEAVYVLNDLQKLALFGTCNPDLDNLQITTGS